MADDIVTRLRAAARSGDLPLGVSFDCDAVADEIERLRADNAGLRFRLADLQRGIDHDPATCALLVCNRCDPWEDSRD